MNMSKADLIEEVSHAVEMSRRKSAVIVESILESIVKALHSGDKVEIRGFGGFRTRRRQARIGRNPKTGARVEVPAKKILYFKPAKELKDVLNNSGAAPGLLLAGGTIQSPIK
jgi:integration host factor subunit beta